MTGPFASALQPTLQPMESTRPIVNQRLFAQGYAPLFGLNAGVTLIELLVTIAVLSIILALGIPNLREFLVRSQVGSITADFSNDIYRARSEAINRNSCTTICMSANTANAINGGTPTCAAAGNNWQAGWIIFANPTCSAALNNPIQNNNQLISVRQSGSTNFVLSTAPALRRITFDSRGLTNSGQRNFTLEYSPENVGNSTHYRTICLSSAGRVTTKQYGGVGACP
jgi:type IV fimbrial biogenesis protein FimT